MTEPLDQDIHTRVTRIETKIDIIGAQVAALTASLVHPESGYVPRSEIRLMADNSLRDRESIRAFAEKVNDDRYADIQDIKKKIDGIYWRMWSFLVGLFLVAIGWAYNFASVHR